MTTKEKLAFLNNLQDRINLLEEKKKIFTSRIKFCHFEVTDHYGNKWGRVETYGFGELLSAAYGSKLRSLISDEFENFLLTVEREIDCRIEELKLQLEEMLK